MSTTAGPAPVLGPPAPRSALPLVVWVVAVGTFLMATSEFLVAGVLPEVARDFRVDIGSAGLAITVFAIGMVIGSPTMVLLTLRLPRRATLVLLLLVFAAGHVVGALSTAFGVLLLARFVTALATGAFWAIAGQVAADAAGDGARSRALGIVGAGGMLANVLGVPLGSIAGQVAGWRGPFWALAVLALLAAAAIARFVPHARADRGLSVRGELVALRSGRLWLVLLTCAFATGGVLSLYSYISPLLTDRTGLPETAVPLALVLFGIASLIGVVIAGRLGDAHPYRVMLGVAVVTTLAIAGLVLTSTAAAPTLILFTVVGLTGLSVNPILAALAMRFGGSAPTLANALTPSAFNVGTAIGTGATAALFGTALGDLSPVLVGLVGAALVLLGVLTLTLLQLRRTAR
ncbi:MFS transporter [uncultured Amnibacterium sp.]|uniref:MFS transporter n=1 Tax=uncultured Amnibacterium sp. TaxID=1631851 RepID=UPI0035CB09E6